MDNTPPTSDLISNLPKNVTENILIRLPLKEAVKTSVLSKTWQYKWVTIPQLVFDSYNLGSAITTNELSKIINQIVFAHHGPILKFSIPKIESCPEIDHSLSLLTTKGLEELTINIWKGKRHKLPNYLFSCLELSHLSLDHCVFLPPPTFQGLNRLKCIEFYEIELGSDFCESFITKCPLLERLTLHSRRKLDSLVLDAPNLKFLDFAGSVTLIRFYNTPLLEKVLIQYFGLWSFDLLRLISWLKALSSLPALDFLDLSSLRVLPDTMQENIEYVDQLPSNLNLSILVLPKLWLRGPHTRANINFVLRLIIIFPNLRKLKIQGLISKIDNIDHDDANAARQFQSQDFVDISSSRLQEIEILSASGTNFEMEFLKLLLAKLPVLKRMQICHSKGRTADQKLSFLEKTIQLQCASPTVEVVFLDPDAN